MQIPDKLRILGHEVIVDKRADDPIYMKAGSYFGWYGRIVVNFDKDRPEDDIAETLLHEIIEIINDSLNLEMQHQIIQILAAVLFSVIRNNQLNFADNTDPRGTSSINKES
jgi:hypothetical protein